MSDAESFTDPLAPAPIPADNPPVEPKATEPGKNGEGSSALARLEDDGGPPTTTPSAAEVTDSPETPDRHKVGLEDSSYSPQLMVTSALTPPVAAPALPAHPVDHTLLEERIRRLEATILHLTEQNTAASPTHPQPAAAIPVAPAAPSATGIWSDAARRQVTPTVPNFHPAAAAPPAWPSFRNSMIWLLWDTWAEARAIVRMFVDPRYHFPWSVRLLLLGLVAAFLTTKYWVPGSSIPILGDWLLVKLVDFLLAFILFKWLGHEARRYRQTSPDLPANLRL